MEFYKIWYLVFLCVLLKVRNCQDVQPTAPPKNLLLSNCDLYTNTYLAPDHTFSPQSDGHVKCLAMCSQEEKCRAFTYELVTHRRVKKLRPYKKWVQEKLKSPYGRCRLFSEGSILLPGGLQCYLLSSHLDCDTEHQKYIDRRPFPCSANTCTDIQGNTFKRGSFGSCWCAKSFYGKSCSNKCDCGTAECDLHTGACICDKAHQGKDCAITKPEYAPSTELNVLLPDCNFDDSVKLTTQIWPNDGRNEHLCLAHCVELDGCRAFTYEVHVFESVAYVYCRMFSAPLKIYQRYARCFVVEPHQITSSSISSTTPTLMSSTTTSSIASTTPITTPTTSSIASTTPITTPTTSSIASTTPITTPTTSSIASTTPITTPTTSFTNSSTNSSSNTHKAEFVTTKPITPETTSTISSSTTSITSTTTSYNAAPPCNCTRNHSLGCSPTSGQCICKDPFTGNLCQDLAPFYYIAKNNAVYPCNCTRNHSLGCSPTTGRCLCKEHFTGSLCRDVSPFYYVANNSARPCDCKQTNLERCAPDGSCVCKHPFKDNCAIIKEFYMLNGSRCNHCFGGNSKGCHLVCLIDICFASFYFCV